MKRGKSEKSWFTTLYETFGADVDLSRCPVRLLPELLLFELPARWRLHSSMNGMYVGACSSPSCNANKLWRETIHVQESQLNMLRGSIYSRSTAEVIGGSSRDSRGVDEFKWILTASSTVVPLQGVDIERERRRRTADGTDIHRFGIGSRGTVASDNIHRILMRKTFSGHNCAKSKWR